jgi:Rod binding domain-containing protein
MRGINKDSKDSSAMDYYQGMINKERSSIMAKNNGGVGIQKLILDQIYPSHLRNNVTFEYFKRTQENISNW